MNALYVSSLDTQGEPVVAYSARDNRHLSALPTGAYIRTQYGGMTMAMKVNLKPDLEHEMEELLAISGARTKTEYINAAVRERNERIRRERHLAGLRAYFTRHGDELRRVNLELRAAARQVDED